MVVAPRLVNKDKAKPLKKLSANAMKKLLRRATYIAEIAQGHGCLIKKDRMTVEWQVGMHFCHSRHSGGSGYEEMDRIYLKIASRAALEKARRPSSSGWDLIGLKDRWWRLRL